MIELNPFLQPVNSPIASRSGNTGYDFDSEYERNIVTNSKVASIVADKIAAGTVNVQVGIGEGNILLDGENNYILINDGTDDRILIGKQENGF